MSYQIARNYVSVTNIWCIVFNVGSRELTCLVSSMEH
uniref:Uncharacterized protein n=1 Tax=Arundo donax TaxID=35708 RepID=A0A0A9AKR7_ARUDO